MRVFRNFHPRFILAATLIAAVLVTSGGNTVPLQAPRMAHAQANTATPPAPPNTNGARLAHCPPNNLSPELWNAFMNRLPPNEAAQYAHQPTLCPPAPNATAPQNLNRPAAAAQQAEITAPDGTPDTKMGISTSLSGNTALFGAPGYGSGTGAVYVFAQSGGTWAQQQIITASDTAIGDGFGGEVSLSGDTAVVSADGQNGGTGAVYVYVRSGTTWIQRAKLIASGATAKSYFGSAVALSGDTLVVGAFGTNSNTGAAYIFTRSGGTTWMQQATLTANDAAAGDIFGVSVALDTTTNSVVIGAWGKNLGGVSGAGAAYVFVQNAGIWTQQTELTHANPTRNDNFGQAVAISGDTVVVDLYDNSNVEGVVYVFVRSGSAWTEQAKLSFGYGFNNFDSLSINGDTIAVDEQAGNSAATVYLFVRNGTAWSLQQKIAANFVDPVSLDKDTLSIGNGYKNTGGTGYIYNRSGSTWNLTQTLAGTGTTPGTFFGEQVSIDGNTAAISSAPSAVYMFVKSSGVWNFQAKIPSPAANTYFNSISLSGDTLALSSSSDANYTGTVYIYVRSGSTWAQQAKLIASDAIPHDDFGSSVSLKGDTLVASAPGHNNVVGAAYVFTRSGSTWSQQAELVPTNLIPSTYYLSFGSNPHSVALDKSQNTVAIGSPWQDNRAGAVYIFIRNSNNIWSQQIKLPGSGANAYFGGVVALDGPWLAIGLPYGNNNGQVNLFAQNAGTWSLAATLTNGFDFGEQVVLDGVDLLVTSPQGTVRATYLYTYDDTAWVQKQVFQPSDANLNDYIYDVAISGSTILLGSPYHNASTGVVYAFGVPDGPDTIGVYRAGTFYMRNHNTTGYADITVAYNPATQPYPIVGDWTGSGIDTVGVYDQSNGQFMLRNSNTPGAPDETFGLGVASDQPLSGRWQASATHSGVGVFRPSNGLIYLKNDLSTGYADGSVAKSGTVG